MKNCNKNEENDEDQKYQNNAIGGVGKTKSEKESLRKRN